MFVFNKKYFAATILLFAIEVLIALFLTDNFVRPFVGDVIVVILIYCFFKTFFNIPSLIISLFTLLFSVSVETFQYFHIIEKLGLENNQLARVVIGTSFSWNDIIAYVLGLTIILIIDLYMTDRKQVMG